MVACAQQADTPRMRPLPAGCEHLVGSCCTIVILRNLPASTKQVVFHAQWDGWLHPASRIPRPLVCRLTDPPKGTVTVSVEEVIYVGSADNTSAAFSATPLALTFTADDYSQNQTILVTKSEQGLGTVPDACCWWREPAPR